MNDPVIWKPSDSAARFSGYCVAISAAPNMTQLAEVCERMIADKRLTSNQKDALETLAISREHFLNWDQKGLS